MKEKKLLLLFTLPLLFAACEKEIDVDYRQVAPMYVAEATLTQEKATVRLSTTQDVTDNDRDTHVVTGATIVLSWQGEEMGKFTYTKNGIYTANLTGVPGNTYDIDIYVDDQHFSSSSTMQEKPVMNSFRFVWKKVLSERMLFADLRLQDEPSKSNYYFMHIYRNNVGYRWAVMTDEKNPNNELQQLFSCTTERDMNKGDEDALQDGDRIRVEIRAIDRRSYDYLYSMQVMDNAGSNPIQNFSGGCLGYFSAYSFITHQLTFQRSQVEEDDADK